MAKQSIREIIERMLEVQEINLLALQQVCAVLNTLKPLATDEDELLDNTDLKEILKIGNTSIWRLRVSNQIPSKKIGGKWYYSKSDVLKFKALQEKQSSVIAVGLSSMCVSVR